MRFKRLACWALGLAAIGGLAPCAQAHHSFPATYVVDQQVTIQGTVVQFLFRNPHTFIHVMAPDKAGVMQRWAVEWGAGQALSGENIGNDTLKPGDKVVITGNPGRDPSDHRIRLHAIERPSDGWKWSGTFG
jgi:DNA/RNA endonuclease YhcR with UshA esterase domain